MFLSIHVSILVNLCWLTSWCVLGDNVSTTINSNLHKYHLCGTRAHFDCFCRLLSWISNCYHDYTSLTHWGRVTHRCISKLNTIDSDNGLSPGRRQAIIWTNAGTLLIGPLGKNPLENVVVKLTAILSRPQCVKSASHKYHTTNYISLVDWGNGWCLVVCPFRTRVVLYRTFGRDYCVWTWQFIIKLKRTESTEFAAYFRWRYIICSAKFVKF